MLPSHRRRAGVPVVTAAEIADSAEVTSPLPASPALKSPAPPKSDIPGSPPPNSPDRSGIFAFAAATFGRWVAARVQPDELRTGLLDALTAAAAVHRKPPTNPVTPPSSAGTTVPSSSLPGSPPSAAAAGSDPAAEVSCRELLPRHPRHRPHQIHRGTQFHHQRVGARPLRAPGSAVAVPVVAGIGDRRREGGGAVLLIDRHRWCGLASANCPCSAVIAGPYSPTVGGVEFAATAIFSRCVNVSNICQVGIAALVRR